MLHSIVYLFKEVQMMSRKQVVRMQQQVRHLQQALGKLGPVMRGSVVVIGTRNKQPYFSVNKDKKTRLIYLGKKRVARAQEYSNNYQQLLMIIEEMTALNMELLKMDAGL
jgi:hypothetical protein